MNTSHPIGVKVLTRIRGHGMGWIFTAADFADLGTRAAIDQALSRSARQGLIRRIAAGLYDYPKVNPALGGRLSPSPHAMVEAVARRTGSRLLPSGAMSANLLGLSTQIPAKMVYLTDGRTRTVRLGPYTFVFRHASPRTMAVSGRTSGLVFQALRYLGKDRVTESVVGKLQDSLSAKDKRQLERDMRHAVGWMRPVLTRIASRTGGK